MKHVLVVVLLAAVALAGCTGDDEPSNGGEGSTETGGTTGANPGSSELLRAQATTASNETIAFTESGATPQTIDCMGDCEYVFYSISDRMQPDTAYFLEVQLTWTYENNYQGGPSMVLVGDAGIRDYSGPESDFDAATIDLTATVLAQADTDVSLRIGGGFQPPDHVVDVLLTPVTDAIPQYAPAAVTVPAGASLVVETLSGDGRVAVYDGDNSLVNVTSISAPEGNPAGNKVYSTTLVHSVAEETEFVVFTLDDIWAKLYVLQETEAVAPVLRHLALEVERTDLGTINSGGPQTFTYTIDGNPLSYGYRYGQPDCFAPNPSTCYSTSQADHRMLDPNGNQVQSGGVDGFCYCGGFNSFTVHYDEMPHLEGDYTIEWTSTESQNVILQGYTWSYVR